MNNIFLSQLKQITNKPYCAFLLITSLHHLREFYCLSSKENNYKNYQQLGRAIEQCSIHNIQPFLNHLKFIERNLFLKLHKIDDNYNFDDHNDLLHYYFAQRIVKGIENIKQQIKAKRFKKQTSWETIVLYAQILNIHFLPKKTDFDNIWLKQLVQKYRFFEIHIDLWKNQCSRQQIEDSFHTFCLALKIHNNNLGHNQLSIYVGEFKKDFENSAYFSDGRYLMLQDFSGFTHEWAHYIDNRAFFDSHDNTIMNHYGVVSEYHSDLLCATLFIKPKQIKFYSLYSLLGKLIINEKTRKNTKYYNFCKNYQHKEQDPYYWIRMTELFARVFEVYMANKTQYSILNDDLETYHNWEVYPKIKILEPLYKDIQQFISLSTEN